MHSFQHAILLLNEEKRRFEFEVENSIAYIEFIKNNDGIVFLTHTEVPVELEGKGVGSEMVSRTLNWIKEHGYTLAPLCPFVAAYLKRHSEWADILAPGFHV
ncbi:N-acetyltransferase [Flavobacterium sp. SM15]|uniref:GNAT family N-acetyltransferase n=1 Tax=Flavobacterium sp. SM15 TaxID=2908005 RepID=UPI001EDAAB06|nr:GNAT family N-acetyltransferase [Flavobacterium sp. SM15]MCG2610830.1 N-acetyltransferase [Flavobacterium sp. SM15]